MARPSKSDPQQYRVYALEREFQGPTHQQLTKKEIRELCDTVCSRYGVPRVRLKYRDLKGWAATCRPCGLIEVGVKRSSRTVLTLLHELSHHVHNCLVGERAWKRNGDAGHGKEFMACEMHILDRCYLIPFVAMKALCRARKIKFCDPGNSGTLASLKRAIRAK